MNNDTVNREHLLKKYGTEQVFVVPYSSTENVPDKISNDLGSLEYDKGRYAQRYLVEGNLSMIQIIPCIVISNSDSSKFFITERLQGDERLQGKLSIIIGGHMNPQDGMPINGDYSCFRNCLIREISEEIKYKTGSIAYYASKLIRDLSSSTPDHIGIVYRGFVDNNDIKHIKINEKESLKGMWMTEQELIKNYSRFETWGQMIISHIVTGDKL